MTLPKNVLYYGKEAPLPEQIALRAGPLRLLFEAGDLRYIKLGDQEILRRVYVAIRDRNWGTVTPVISNLEIEAGSDAFHISYDVENKQGDIDFFWHGTINGDAQGTISFTMDGEARSTFLRNRIGFCVLHPIEAAGLNCRIEHVNDIVDECPFPETIAPQLVIDGKPTPVEPFTTMRTLAHEVRPGLWAEVRFEGEVFELEDQRNWTDASYKTYGTPLSLPFPVEIEAGTKIAQSVTLRLQGEIPKESDHSSDSNLTVSVGSSAVSAMPRIGLGVASHGRPLSSTEIDRLKALNLAHLRVDLKPSQPDTESRLRRATDEAEALGIPLEIAVTLTDNAAEELATVAGMCKQIAPPVWAWLIFHATERSTSEQWVRLARQHLSDYDPAALFGAGTDAFFTELNRARQPVGGMDLVAYSINPQVHAFDNASLVETLEAQAPTVETARQFIGDRPLAISPITLKIRWSPHATGPEPEPGPGELPSQVDERQMSLFGACWTTGSLKYTGQSEVQSVTYYETTGWRGVMETETGSAIPDKFRSLPGAVFPLYHVLADVGEFTGGEVLPTTTADSLRVDGLALRKDGRTRLLLANMTAEPQQVAVKGLAGPVWLRKLDETNAEAAMQSPEAFRNQTGDLWETTDGALEFELLPYAIARIDRRGGNQ